MNRDEIIRMAREAGFETAQDWALFPSGFVVVVERFATLVATFVADRMIRNGYRKCAEGQRETQFCGQLESAVAGAIATEREACAKVCDEIAQRDETGYGVAEDCADAIRARNKG